MVQGLLGSASSSSYFQPPNSARDDDSVLGVRCNEAANKRIRLTPKDNDDQARMAELLLNIPPIGLSMPPMSSLVSSVEKCLNCTGSEAKGNYQYQPNNLRAKAVDYGSQPISEKLKASNFSATLLRIGSWERVTKNEGDLVAKCYYAKKKLVWEFLERGLKSKIEIQWSDILAMKADIKEDKPGILEIELSKPPTFHEETDPQPRKHTMWRLTTDFTRGEASKWRRHYLKFPPGSLDKHYEKLLQCDSRLYSLSQQRFPSLQSPIFESNSYGFPGFSFDYSGRALDMNLGMQCPTFPSIHSPFPNQHIQSYVTTTQPSLKETPSPISVMDFSHSDEHTRSRVFENPNMALWGPQVINDAHSLPWGTQNMTTYPGALAMNQVQGPTPVILPTEMNQAIAYQNYNLPTFGQAGMRPNPQATEFFNGLEDQLLSDSSQVGGCEYYDKHDMTRVASFGMLANAFNEENHGSNDGSNLTFYGQDRSSGDDQDFVMSASEHGHEIGSSQLYQQQAMNYIPPQVNAENPMMQNPWNNFTYQGMDGFNHVNGVQRWA